MRRIQKGFFLFFCFVQQMAEQLIPVTDEQRHDLPAFCLFHGAWRDAIRAKVKQASGMDMSSGEWVAMMNCEPKARLSLIMNASVS